MTERFSSEGAKDLLAKAIQTMENNVEYADALYERAEGVSIARARANIRADLKYSMLPSVQPTNIAVEPGDMCLEEMIATTKEGIYLEQLSSSSSDSVTTSFGSEIRNAYLIEKGELSTPLKGGQINGFLLDSQDTEGHEAPGLLNQISGISRKTLIAGRCITPYIRFENVQIAGK